VATYVGHELSLLGHSTMVADADTYGGAVAQLLGLLDEAPGIAAAARAVTSGEFDQAALSGSAREVAPSLRVLTGIVRPDRWPELRRGALAQVWAQSRLLVDVTVVDCGFGLEQDEELSYDTSAPQRNGATLATLEDCDILLAVGRADPIGVHRLIRALPEARKAAPTASVRVVLTRVRKSAVGSTPERQLRDNLERHAGAEDVVLIPDDSEGYDKALRTGRFLAEVAPRSAARAALSALARELAPEVDGVGRRRRRSKATVGS
jgi:Flp pilus assembly CpaE family ATPase